MKTYNYYTDPGHGWMKVSISDLADLELTDKISPYSYARGAWVYLEEDWDMHQFFVAHFKLYGAEPKIKRLHTERLSKIRSYSRYNR